MRAREIHAPSRGRNTLCTAVTIAVALAGVASSRAQAATAAELVGKCGAQLEAAEFEQAVETAGRAVEAAERSDDRRSHGTAEQIRGLALAAMGRTEEALRSARALDERGLPVAAWNVHSAVASARCAFGEAADLQLRIRALHPGVNDKSTEANLADLDIREARIARAIERLEHARSLPWHSSFTPAIRAVGDDTIVRLLVSAYARAGRAEDVRTIGLSAERIRELESYATRYADYALAQRRSLFQAADSLATAIITVTMLDGSRERVAPLRERLSAVLKAYAETPSPCRQRFPDILALHTPGNRRILSARAEEADGDGDGIADKADRCPTEPEVYNGVDDQDGCPDDAPGRWVGREIRLKREIPFEFDSAVILGEAAPTLDWLASFLKTRPEITKVLVEGHTDDQGEDDYNLDLSRRRAQAVCDALIAREIVRDRLEYAGYGESRPKVLGTDDAARAANRRVEILTTVTTLAEVERPVREATDERARAQAAQAEVARQARDAAEERGRAHARTADGEDLGPIAVRLGRVARKKSPVWFPHERHVRRSTPCAACHHRGAYSQTCFSCHGAAEAPGVPSAKRAFHGSCHGCHKETAKAGQRSGPTTCVGCHPR